MGSSSSKSASYTEADLVSGLQEGKFKNIVIMCGAGISTNAGIPDFRTPSAGLYFKLRKYNLPYPEAVFEGSYFHRNPLPFFGLIRELFPSTLTPTTTHKFFSLLNQKGILRRIYTQNIDALEYLAGVPEDKIVEAHGSFQSSYCTACKKTYDLKWLKTEIFTPDKNDGVPKCEDCQGVVRPNVVLFGEALPNRFWVNITPDFEACDLLLVFGTSLVVSPFNTLVGKPGSAVPRVYINMTKPGSSGSMLGWFLNLAANVDFTRSSDMVMLGDCDQTVQGICNKLDWKEQLDKVEVNNLEDIS
eukprot:GFUD01091564.1.p1 GENE.GFUD01091564.1~~GFUD01091564.1.p1  ORF type:complete len:302 (-),score=92.77 GFUD01091564.1:160-1065(-)